MIYLKTLVTDGNYSVEVYNESGVNVTPDYTIKSKLYRQNENKEYIFLLETDEKTLSLNPDNFKNESSIFTTVFVDGYLYKTFLKTPVKSSTVTQTYAFLYRSHTPLVEISNPFLDRFNYFMPRWSTAYKNDVTVFSKLTYPLFANIEKSFFKTSSIVSNSLLNKTTTKKVLKLRTPVGKVVDKDGVEKRFTYNKENSPITRVLSKDTFVSVRDFVRILSKDFLLPIFLKKGSSKLYIKSPLQSTVTISGINTDGVFVEETFTFNTLVVKQSQYNYRKIHHFESTHLETVLTNYLDCSEDHLAEHFEKLPAFISTSKDQQYPLLTLADNRLYTRFVKEAMFEYEGHSYGVAPNTKSIFVNDEMDVISLDTNLNLSTGILRKNLEVDMPTLPSNNNNTFVFVSDVDHSTDTVSFKIATKDLIEHAETYAVTIKVQSNQGTYYLDSTTNSFVDTPVNYFLEKINSLDFSVDINDLDFISLIVETNTEKFQASFRNDKVNLKPQLTDIDSLYFINGLLHVSTKGSLKELVTYKDYYEIARDGSYIFYEDDLTVYSLKGEKLDG